MGRVSVDENELAGGAGLASVLFELALVDFSQPRGNTESPMARYGFSGS